MKRLTPLFLALSLSCSFGQQTPQQIENSSAGFRYYSARDLAVADTYLLSVLVGMSATSPATLLANASAWKAFADRDLMNVQTYLLAQFNGMVLPNAQSTNNGVLSTNGLNILISPNSTTAVFTNAGLAIAIGANIPTGSVLGNGIWIGGGGAGFGGSAGSNSVSIGSGAGAAGVSDGLYTSVGAIALGNQIDSFGPGSICIGNTASSVNADSWNTVIVGNYSTDGSPPGLTNAFVFGHHVAGNLANNTFYFGNGGGGGTNAGRTRNFVFQSGGAYMDDGALIGNAWGLTNGTFHYGTNSVTEGGATVTLDAKKFMTVIATNASFAFGGIANLTGPGNVDGGEVWVTNITGGVLTATFGGGWAQDKPNGLNAPNSTWGITNGSGYSHMTWRAMSGSFSNYILYGKQ